MSYPETQPGDADTPHTHPPHTETTAEEPAQLGPAGRFSGVLFSPSEAFTFAFKRRVWAGTRLESCRRTDFLSSLRVAFSTSTCSLPFFSGLLGGNSGEPYLPVHL